MAGSDDNGLRQLIDVNMGFVENERLGAKGRQFFLERLDDNLQFRRGRGAIATKKSFIDDLGRPGNASEVLTAELRQVQVLGDQAFVEVIVYLKGTRGNKPIDGHFRNLRFFERNENGDWKCVQWFNKGL
jgi:ketosteroid isomerase-like protein